VKQSPMPRRRAPLKAGKPMKRGTGPKRTPLTGRRSPMPVCGTGYATESAARNSKRGQAEGAEFEKCLLRDCGKWHVRLPGKPRFGLAEGRDTGPGRETREAVYLRDSNCCVCCGTPLAGKPRSIGHRKRRSQGGSNETSNLLSFLGLGINQLDPDDHHARIDSRLDPNDEARGYTVRSWQDPAAVSVMVTGFGGSGSRVFLSDDGEYLSAPPDWAEAS
jgi:hypothetical protein